MNDKVSKINDENELGGFEVIEGWLSKKPKFLKDYFENNPNAFNEVKKKTIIVLNTVREVTDEDRVKWN